MLKKVNKRVISRRRTNSAGSDASPKRTPKARSSQESGSQFPARLPSSSRRLTLSGNPRSSAGNTSSAPKSAKASVRFHSEASELAFSPEPSEEQKPMGSPLSFGHVSSEVSESPDLDHIQCHVGRSPCCVAVVEETKALVIAEFLAQSLDKQANFDSHMEEARREIEALRSQLQHSRGECADLQACQRQLRQASEEISSLRKRLQQSERACEELKEKRAQRNNRRSDEVETEIASLKSKLQCSEIECEESKKQQEVAWQLCGVLRDYASQLQPATAQLPLSSSPAQAEEGDCLTGRLPLEAVRWWMYNNPASASAWSAVTEKMEARAALQPPIPSLMSGVPNARKSPRAGPRELLAHLQGLPQRP